MNTIASNQTAAAHSQADERVSPNLGKTMSSGICHGRVPEVDFEKFVPAQWWKTVFADNLYLKTDGDVVEDPEITKEELRMLEANPAILSIFKRGESLKSGFDQPTTILDLCCGQGRHSLLLSERYPALRLFGHDQSAYLISLARERALHSLGPSPDRTALPTFTVGDCRSVPYGDKDFDLVMVMGNSFGYFSANDVTVEGADADDGDRAVLHEANRLLKKGGRLVLDLVDGGYMRENFSPRSWEWIDDQTFVCRERCLSQDKKRLHSREVVVAATRGVVRDQFYSERLYDRAELVELLSEIGFEIDSNQTETIDDEGLNTVTAAREMSQRGQDLGMMEQRLLIFAEKAREAPSSKKGSIPIDPIAEQQQCKRTSLNETVRELIEKFRESVVADDFTDRQLAEILAKDEDVQKDIETGSPLKEHNDALISPAVISPSSYHLLPPPPFSDNKVTLIMGDPSLPCREKLNGVWNVEDFDTRRKLIKALLDCGYASDQIVVLESHRDLIRDLIATPPSFVFNLCDEGFMNEALKELHVTALLEMCQINYSGAGPVCLGVCYDKGLVNSTASKLNINTPNETYLLFPEAVDSQQITVKDIDNALEHKSIHFPAFVKPMKGDNSLGITGKSICETREDLSLYIHSVVQEYGIKEYIIQEYLTGTEYSVGMIGNPETGFHFLPILQVDYTKVVQQYGLQPILGWESKWDPESPYWNEVDFFTAKRIPRAKQKKSKDASKVESGMSSENATSDKSSSSSGLLLTGGLTEEEEEELKRSCAILFERFGCRDYARFDWRADREIQWNPATGEMRPLRQSQSSSSSKDSVAKTDSVTSNLNAPEEHDDSLSATTETSASDSGHGSSRASDDDPRGREASPTRGHRRTPRLRSLKLLEVNPNPGWCWDGKLAKMAHAAGLEYPDMIKSILWAGWERIYGREGMAGVASTLRQKSSAPRQTTSASADSVAADH